MWATIPDRLPHPSMSKARGGRGKQWAVFLHLLKLLLRSNQPRLLMAFKWRGASLDLEQCTFPNTPPIHPKQNQEGGRANNPLHIYELSDFKFKNQQSKFKQTLSNFKCSPCQFLLSTLLCTVCGVSLGVQNRFDGLRQIDRLGQDWPEASHDDAD